VTGCPSLTYEVTPGQWESIKAAVVEQMPGLAPMADAGSGKHDGVTLVWVYGDGTLTLTVTDSPFWLSCSMLNGEIDGLIRSLRT
jgi:hypothetical protein